MTNTITQLDHQDGGRKRTSGRRVIALVGALIAFGTLLSSGADAAGYNQRNRAAPLGYAYNTQANPNYGFGPLVAVQPTDVVSGTGSWAAIRIRSFGARFCATTTAGPTSPWICRACGPRQGTLALLSKTVVCLPYSSASSLRAAAFSRQ